MAGCKDRRPPGFRIPLAEPARDPGYWDMRCRTVACYGRYPCRVVQKVKKTGLYLNPNPHFRAISRRDRSSAAATWFPQLQDLPINSGSVSPPCTLRFTGVCTGPAADRKAILKVAAGPWEWRSPVRAPRIAGGGRTWVGPGCGIGRGGQRHRWRGLRGSVPGR